MQSSKFLKLAKKIKEENKEMFDVLLEFEKTKKIRTKEKLNFTIDKGVSSRFKKFCREKSYNMSAIIEKAMKKEMGEK